MKQLIATGTIEIEATASRVWDVLVKCEHIREWDDVPETFNADSLSLGSVLEWNGSARLTVTRFELAQYVQMSYHNPKWEGEVDGIVYAFEVDSSNGPSVLSISVGDWAKAPDGKGEDYHQASVEFVQDALSKIKEIAER